VQPELGSLREAARAGPADRTLSDSGACLRLGDIAEATSLRGFLPDLAGKSVLVGPRSQLATALALIELDGVAARVLLCPPDLADAHLPALVAAGGIDAIIGDADERWRNLGVSLIVTPSLALERATAPCSNQNTQWLLLTSGTSGTPKIVAHSLATLAGAMANEPAPSEPPFWATFYDIRRYGGLQILLRALLGGGSLALSEPGEPLRDHLARLARAGVTHLSGTPSHWRRVLAGAPVEGFAPQTIRLSGEIADQAVLDGLRRAFPAASIAHAYASTEAGVGFVVEDGLEGFPAAFMDAPGGPVTMTVVDGSLRLRSNRTAFAYVGAGAGALRDADGFVDTGDMVEQRGKRVYFVGRRGGIINVGGLKVHPEEVEAVINRHPDVRMARVRSRRSPLIGAVVTAEIVIAPGTDDDRAAGIRDEVTAACRLALDAHKRPATITIVPALDVTPAGKLARADA
jgi:acyl-CoA synthetase (AMP-forming)/AMP-acid ligase II